MTDEDDNYAHPTDFDDEQWIHIQALILSSNKELLEELLPQAEELTQLQLETKFPKKFGFHTIPAVPVEIIEAKLKELNV